MPQHKPKVLCLLLSQGTLARPHAQPCLLDPHQHLSQMAQVFLPGVAGDNDVIKVGASELLSPLQDTDHHPLECHRSFVQAKGQHRKVEVSKGCLEGRQLLAVFRQWDLPVPLAEVEGT